eukprot:Blabericola_migrator_1__7797@NODE_3991_length_1395_cov_56_676958_g2461_i0_p1_GENE_NODE_3991_length_1395_cov_56_676958_g2461_i0NODE_3991_length_1395_cov_56_676958_g2461_i0_p1_ORF_typecomplete_len416_score120_19_NODE_3991_length_1395_cov_56_676958_g2461_i01061353
MTVLTTDASKLSSMFRICRDIQPPDPKVDTALEKELDKTAAELKELILSLAVVKASRQELLKAKTAALEQLSTLTALGDDESSLVTSGSPLSQRLEETLNANVSLNIKALSVWNIVTQTDPAQYSEDEWRAILCEAPDKLDEVLKKAYQVWDTFVFKELSELTTLAEEEISDFLRERFQSSELLKLVQRSQHSWLNWQLLNANFESMLRLYVVGLKLVAHMAESVQFESGFQLLSLLQMDSAEDLGQQATKFISFAEPAYDETKQLLETRCKAHFNNLLKGFLQSLSGAHVLLRLQTSRKMKVTNLSDCMKELENLAKLTQTTLARSDKALTDSLWLSYVKGYESVTLKSATEIQLQQESGGKGVSKDDGTPIHQLIKNTEGAIEIFQKYCSPDVPGVHQTLTALAAKLARIAKS